MASMFYLVSTAPWLDGRYGYAHTALRSCRKIAGNDIQMLVSLLRCLGPDPSCSSEPAVRRKASPNDEWADGKNQETTLAKCSIIHLSGTRWQYGIGGPEYRTFFFFFWFFF